MEQALEIKCDLTVVKRFNREEKVGYLQAIVNALKDIPKQGRTPFMFTALLQNGRELEMKERFANVVNYSENIKGGLCNTTFLLIFTCLVVASYSFILQPSFEAPHSINGVNVIEFDGVDSYLRKTKNGQFELYIQNELKGVVTKESADMFIEDGFPIVE